MNRDRLSLIGHASLDLMSPVPAAGLERLLDLAGISKGDAALDIGSGKGGIAVLALRRGARVTMVERSPLFASLAREAAAHAGFADRARVVKSDGRAFAAYATPGQFKLAICVGATQALGGRDAALKVLARLTAPNGHVLFGEPYWRQPPTAEYLAVLGATSDALGTRADNVAAARARGLSVVDEEIADGERFEAYERAWFGGLERFADDHPDDPDAAKIRSIGASRREAFERWGRHQLGFAVHLLVRADR